MMNFEKLHAQGETGDSGKDVWVFLVQQEC